MIITLTKANFSLNNIGTLNSFAILTDLSLGLTYSGPALTSRGESVTAAITTLPNYKVNKDSVVITMGGVAVTSGITVTNTSININIANVTGTIVIVATATYSVLNAGLDLILGYANGTDVADGLLQTRVRTAYIFGSYTLTVNPEYRIRMVITDLDNESAVSGTIYSKTSTTLTSIDVKNENKWSIITFAHADANTAISPEDDIVATYVPYKPKNWAEGDTLTTTLAQGYVVSSPIPTSNSDNTTRVKTAVITGPFRIECNDQWVVRGVSTSTAADGYTGGVDVVKNGALESYDCTDDCLGFSVVTFASKANAANPISPEDDIIKRLVAMVEV